MPENLRDGVLRGCRGPSRDVTDDFVKQNVSLASYLLVIVVATAAFAVAADAAAAAAKMQRSSFARRSRGVSTSSGFYERSKLCLGTAYSYDVNDPRYAEGVHDGNCEYPGVFIGDRYADVETIELDDNERNNTEDCLSSIHEDFIENTTKTVFYFVYRDKLHYFDETSTGQIIVRPNHCRFSMIFS